MAIRLIVTDLDGTYICASHISEENRRAVERARALGVKVIACTGRTWAMCDWLIPTIGFDDYCVTSNGASIVKPHNGEIVWSRRLEPSWLPALFDAAMRSGKPFDVFCGPFIHTYTPRRSRWTIGAEERAKFAPPGEYTKLRHFDTYESWLEGTKDVAQLFRVEVGRGEEYPDELREAIDAHGMGNNITMSFIDHYDLCHPEATKQNAIDFLCQKFGVGIDEVMALGDSNNDSGMLRYAGLGVAMGGSDERVQKAADVVAPPCEENGFAWAVEKFVLNPREAANA